MDTKNSIVGVCGAGAMGLGIAQIAAQAGHRTIVVDVNSDALEPGKTKLDKGLSYLVSKGKISPEEKEEIFSRVEFASDLELMRPAAIVIEAIVEYLDIKRGLFQKLESIVSRDAILASNTSSLDLDEIATSVSYRERFIGLHYFNPVPAMKLVEVISARDTADTVAQTCYELMQKWGKIPVRAKNVPGFIVNRVARPFYSEGWQAYADDVASPETIDFIYKHIGGFKMGPLELGDLIGHDINYTAAEEIYKAYEGKTRFWPAEKQREMVALGKLGRKSGEGVFNYSQNQDRPAPNIVSPEQSPISIDAREEDHPFKSWMSQGSIEINSTLPEGFIQYKGVLAGLSCGASSRKLADEFGSPVILFDGLPRAGDAVIAGAASDEVAAEAMREIAGACNLQLVNLKDRPGLVVTRSWLQLANAGADAVADGVGSEEDVDLAMRYGVNYPLGPLEWARDFGLEKAVRALTNISEETGEEMYLPSAYFEAQIEDSQ